MYDIVGDIHGRADELEALLKKLGYEDRGGSYSCPGRTAVFVGDFIDGDGPDQLGAVEIVQRMVVRGAARAVMGNHEFNAIAYHSRCPEGQYLRPHSEKNRNQHRLFLDAVVEGSSRHSGIVEWFRSLPLWLELDGLRVVHACWDESAQAVVGREDGRLTESLLRAASTKGTEEHKAIETLLKGKEVSLPDGLSFPDGYGDERSAIRVRWWSEAQSYRQAFLGPDRVAALVPDVPMPEGVIRPYNPEGAPLVIGHYWLKGEVEPQAPNVACVDYSVAKPGGHLVAYRWDGEPTFDKAKFVAVARRD